MNDRGRRFGLWCGARSGYECPGRLLGFERSLRHAALGKRFRSNGSRGEIHDGGGVWPGMRLVLRWRRAMTDQQNRQAGCGQSGAGYCENALEGNSLFDGRCNARGFDWEWLGALRQARDFKAGQHLTRLWNRRRAWRRGDFINPAASRKRPVHFRNHHRPGDVRLAGRLDNRPRTPAARWHHGFLRRRKRDV